MFWGHFGVKSGLSGPNRDSFRANLGLQYVIQGAKKCQNWSQMVNKWSGKVPGDFEKIRISTILEVILGCFGAILGQV